MNDLTGIESALSDDLPSWMDRLTHMPSDTWRLIEFWKDAVWCCVRPLMPREKGKRVLRLAGYLDRERLNRLTDILAAWSDCKAGIDPTPLLLARCLIIELPETIELTVKPYSRLATAEDVSKESIDTILAAVRSADLFCKRVALRLKVDGVPHPYEETRLIQPPHNPFVMPRHEKAMRMIAAHVAAGRLNVTAIAHELKMTPKGVRGLPGVKDAIKIAREQVKRKRQYYLEVRQGHRSADGTIEAYTDGDDL